MVATVPNIMSTPFRQESISTDNNEMNIHAHCNDRQALTATYSCQITQHGWENSFSFTRSRWKTLPTQDQFF
jgi:hypothetical protein